MDMGQSNRPALLERAASLQAEEAGFASFFRAAILATDSEDLSRLVPQQLEAALRASYVNLLGHSGEGSQLVITPPSSTGAPLIIDVVSPDMPFIVDSTLAALRAAGGAVRMFTHPVVRVEDGRALSVLHIHSDPVADVDALRSEIEATLADVTRAVRDWQPMLDRLRKAVAALQVSPAAQKDEPLRFLDWLGEHNFTFLGMREYRLADNQLQPVAQSGLGIMRDPGLRVLRSGSTFVESTPQHAAFMASAEPLLVTKANVRARVHRRAHMDYVGIKLFGADSQPTGELRIVGLFTAQALATPHTDVSGARLPK